MMRAVENRPLEKGLTLLELLVAVTVITILVSISAVAYDGYRDRVAMMVDETNQKVLQAAAKLYAYDNDALPGVLSQLRPRDIRRAYAMVGEEKKPYTLLAHAGQIWREHIGVDTAEAYLPSHYFNNDLKLITCPSDPTPPSGFDDAGRATGGISYALNPAVAFRPLNWLLDPANAAVVLIVESDDARHVVFRHKKGHKTVGVTVGGKHKKLDPDDSIFTDDGFTTPFMDKTPKTVPLPLPPGVVTDPDPKQSDPLHSDPKHSDPKHSDPKHRHHSDPKHSDPKHSDPKHSDPKHSDPRGIPGSKSGPNIFSGDDDHGRDG